MYWDVIIVLKCKKTEFNIVQDRLICHHSIYEINPDKERKKETKTEKEYIGAPEINANRINSNNNEYQFITCKASVFHQNDERGLKLYLGTVKNLDCSFYTFIQ
jgi:hypothetical protein